MRARWVRKRSDAVRRCDAARRLSRLRDAARWFVDGFVCSHCSDAATLRRRWGFLASSRLRGFVTLRRCDAARGLAASSRLRDAATLRLAISSCLRVIRSGCGRSLASLQWRDAAWTRATLRRCNPGVGGGWGRMRPLQVCIGLNGGALIKYLFSLINNNEPLGVQD